MYVADRLIDVGLRALTTRGTARDSGARRFDRRDARDCRSGRPPVRQRRASTSSTSTAPTARATRPARSKPGSRWLGASSWRFSTPTSCRPADFLMKTHAAFRRPEDRHGPGPLGSHQPGLLAPHQDSVDSARRPFRARARRPQPCRAFFNFNGTAGIWRRAAIDDAGGWQHDTLTEDLDLSYRAQLARLALHFRARPGRAGRSAGGDERLQVAAAPLGEGLDPDLPQAPAADSGGGRAASASRRKRSFTSRPTSTTR